MNKIWIIPLLALSLRAADTPVDGKAAFERLKSLAGTWTATSSMGEAKITVDVIAGGSSIIQREKMGQMEEMVTMIHLDGTRLLMTHYCTARNQPRMEARAYDTAKGEVRFQFLDATNLKTAADGHMHNASFRFVDQNTVHQDWEFFQGGKRVSTESLDYHRVK